MKGRFLLSLLMGAALLAVGCSTLPPWKSAPSGQSAIYGTIEDKNTLLRFMAFADDPGIAAISVEYKFGRGAPRYTLLADKFVRDALREVFSKYREWSSVAAEKNVEITKEISTLTVTQLVRRGGEWDSAGSRDLTFVFTSRIDANGSQQIFMVMRSSSFFGGRDQVALSDSQARDFDSFVDDENVMKGYDEAKKKQDIIDLFK
jgi:hypothetical protein